MESPLNALKYELNEKTKIIGGIKIRMREDASRLKRFEKSIEQYKRSIEALEKVEIMEGEENV